MNYAIIIPDGCADEPQESLGGKTPLEAARLPAMDAVAAEGVVGRANNTPKACRRLRCGQLEPAGLQPAGALHRPGAIEAAAQGIELGPNDWAVRCNLVTVEDQMMESFTAGQISAGSGPTDRSAPTATSAASSSVPLRRQLSASVGLSRAGTGGPAPFSTDTRTTPPHDLTDKPVWDDYPRGPGSDLLNHLMSESVKLFADHPVNVARRAAGKPPATNIWLWGLGSTPRLPPFAELFGMHGAMMAAVDLMRGLAALMGWRRIDVPGATGYLDTDYAAKGRYAVEALEDVDLVCVHVEATDEASHEGNAAAKVDRAGGDRPPHRRPAPRGAKGIWRLSHSRQPRSSDAAADENPRPRRRAVRAGRRRHRARRCHDLRRAHGRSFLAGLSRRLAADGVLPAVGVSGVPGSGPTPGLPGPEMRDVGFQAGCQRLLVLLLWPIPGPTRAVAAASGNWPISAWAAASERSTSGDLPPESLSAWRANSIAAAPSRNRRSGHVANRSARAIHGLRAVGLDLKDRLPLRDRLAEIAAGELCGGKVKSGLQELGRDLEWPAHHARSPRPTGLGGPTGGRVVTWACTKLGSSAIARR